MIVLEKQYPDNRVFNYHKVAEPIINLSENTIKAIIKSWQLEEDALVNNNNYVLFEVDIAFDEWDPSIIQDLENLVLSLEWKPYKSGFVEVITLTLEQLKIKKSKEISGACASEIISGFTSNALGADYLYPANDRDQANLSGTILRSTLPTAQPNDIYLFLCKDSNDVWEFRQHTAAQIQQIGSDAYNAILAARYKNSLLQQQITQATTQAELDAIVW